MAKKWAHFLLTQYFCWTVFLLLFLVPTIYSSIYVELPVVRILINALLASSFFGILLLLARKPGWVALILFPLFVLVVAHIMTSYVTNSGLGTDNLLAIFTSGDADASETTRIYTLAMRSVLAYFFCYVVCVVFSLFCRHRLSSRFRNRTFYILSASYIVSILLSLDRLDTTFPINTINSAIHASDYFSKVKQYPHNVEHFSFSAQQDTLQAPKGRQVYVLVVGESARASHWGMYGYHRNTTPYLSKIDHLVSFEKMLAQATATYKAVPYILSSASMSGNIEDMFHQKSLVSAFREAGFFTAYVSNNMITKSLAAYMKMEADTVVQIPSQKRDGRDYYALDEELLPSLNSLLQTSHPKLFVVLHMFATHSLFTNRYPEAFGRYLPASGLRYEKDRAKIVNAYDNAVLYTDTLLSCMVSLLQEHSAVSSLLYVPDHGVDLFDDSRGRFLQASPTPSYYLLHLPSFVWFSDSLLNIRPDLWTVAHENKGKRANVGTAFHTLMDIASIHTPYYDSSYSLVSPTYQDRPPLFMNNNFEMVYLDDELRNPLDRQRFSQENILLK